MTTAKIQAQIFDGMFCGEREAIISIGDQQVSVLVDKSFVTPGFLEVTIVEWQGEAALIDLSGEPFNGHRRRVVPLSVLSDVSDA